MKAFFADLVLVDMNKKFTVVKEDLLYQCKWSPFEGSTFEASIIKTFVNGNLVYDQGKIIESALGKNLLLIDEQEKIYWIARVYCIFMFKNRGQQPS